MRATEFKAPDWYLTVVSFDPVIEMARASLTSPEKDELLKKSQWDTGEDARLRKYARNG